MFKKENLPNLLTLARIVLIPIFLLMTSLASSNVMHIAAAVVFAIASITDYLDGYLARAWNETSAFGRLLDPIADKLLVATALVVILVKPNMYSLGVTVIPAFVILCREILVSGLREFLREVNVGLPVTKLAKWKTAFQMTALAMMLFKDLWLGWSYVGEFLLWVAATLTFITGYQYYQKSLDYVKAEEAKKVKEVKGVVIDATQPEKVNTMKAKSVSDKKTTRKTQTKKAATKKKNASSKKKA